MTATYDGRTDTDWREELHTEKNWTERHFLSALAVLGKPRSLLDVGCGLGINVTTARDIHIDAYGVDQLTESVGCFYHYNLTKKFILPGKQVDMVWCTEVAEHLDAAAHATLCDTCTENLAEGRGNYLVFSSAFPNQGGSGHISERPAGYWLEQFSLRNLGYRKDLTVLLALVWSNIGSPLYWLANNVLVFEK